MWAQGTIYYMGVLVGATWRIRLIISDAAAMWHAVTITVATFFIVIVNVLIHLYDLL